MRLAAIAALLLLAACSAMPDVEKPEEGRPADLPPPASRPAPPHLDPVPLPFTGWQLLSI